MNKKGFAISGMIYSILILFLLLLFAVLGILGSRKLVLDKLKNDVMNKLNGNLAYENAYKDTSGANQPELFGSLIPIKYDGYNWVYADVMNEWYDYTKQEWANAVILNNGVGASVGDIITEDDIALWYVWIPRYKYTIFNGNNESVPEQVINITFESGTNSTGTVVCKDAINQTDESGNVISEICTDSTSGDIVNGISSYTHPAFTYDGRELTGIWVGKFEVSGTVDAITIKPNVDSLRNQSVSSFFNAIQNIDDVYNTGGESRMIKNMDWGAVAYLKQSNFGLGITDIGINNYRATNKDGTYTHMTGCGVSPGNGIRETCNTYDTKTGMLASTTGNIYGVYDMSGGTREYVMGNMTNENGTFHSSSAGFISGNYPDVKYYDSYGFSESNLTHTRGKLGDATKETLKNFGDIYGGWNSDYAHFVFSNDSWFLRGGNAEDGSYAGVFSSYSTSGDIAYYASSRAVLIPPKEKEILIGTPIVDKVKKLVYNENNQCKTDGKTYEFMGGCYIKSDYSSDLNNYIWYNGFLWRIMGINRDGSIRMITEENVGSISYNTSGVPQFQNSYANKWLNEYFYNSLSDENGLKDIIVKSEFYQSPTLSGTLDENSTYDVITNYVGLLTNAEYFKSSSPHSYLVNGQAFWILDYNNDQKYYVYSSSNVLGNQPSSLFGLRPIINIKPDAIITRGTGLLNDYYVLGEYKNDTSSIENLKDIKIGEYVNLNDKIYRVIEKGNTVKLKLDGYYEETEGEIYKTIYGNDGIFSTTTEIGKKLNTDVLNWLTKGTNQEKLKSMILPSTWYQKDFSYGDTYELLDGDDSIATIENVQVGLIRIGEILSAQSYNILTKNRTELSSEENATPFWTLEHNSSIYAAWILNNDGLLDYKGASSTSYSSALVPVINISSDNAVESGNGTYEKPYVISIK